MVSRRQTDMKIYSHLYESEGSLRDGCWYCQDPATDRDHVPPISWVALIDLEVYQSHLKFLKVPSCQTCNKKLGSEFLLTINDRKKFLYKKLLATRMMKSPNLCEDDYKGMSPEFKRTLKAYQAMRDMENNRLLHLKIPMVDDPTIVNKQEIVEAFPRSSKFVESITEELPCNDALDLLDNIHYLAQRFEGNFRWQEVGENKYLISIIKRNKGSQRYISELTKLRDELENKWH